MSDETIVSDVSLPGQTREESFRDAMAASPLPAVTYFLVGINVLLFLARLVSAPASTMTPTTQQLLAWGADFGPLTLRGEWWRLITSCFLHFNFLHIGMNMYILWQTGRLTEKLFGNVRFALMYLLAGVGGNIAGLYLHPLTVAAGASGAVFGVYGALLAFLLMQRNVVPAAAATGIAKSAAIFIAYNISYGLRSTAIDMAAHIGGLVTGFVVGCLLARPLSPTGQRHFPILTLNVAVCGAAVVYFSLAALSKKTAPQEDLIRSLVAGTSVTIGENDRVIYSGSATKADADSLAKALVKAGYFKNPNSAALLSRGPDGVTVSFLTGESDPARKSDGTTPAKDMSVRLVPFSWDDLQYLAKVQTTGAMIAPSVGGPPIKVALLSREGVVEKVVVVDSRLMTIGTKDTVMYSGTATDQDAEALGRALLDVKFFQDRGARAYLSKGDDGVDVSLLVRDGAWDDPRIVLTLQQMGRKVAKSVSGTPVRIHLVNGRMERKKDLSIQ